MEKAERQISEESGNTDLKTERRKDNIRPNQRDNPRKSASLEWEAPEFEYNPKDVSWYWLSLIISIVLVALAIWQRNFLFALFVLIAWFIVARMAGRFPPVWKFEIDETGIHIKSPDKLSRVVKFHAWHDIAGFDIHDGPDGYKELIIKFRSKLSPFTKINFEEGREKEIADFCRKFIAEEEYEASVSDNLSKLIGF